MGAPSFASGEGWGTDTMSDSPGGMPSEHGAATHSSCHEGLHPMLGGIGPGAPGFARVLRNRHGKTALAEEAVDFAQGVSRLGEPQAWITRLAARGLMRKHFIACAVDKKNGMEE